MERSPRAEEADSGPAAGEDFAALLADFPWQRPSARWRSADPELATTLSRHVFDTLYGRQRIPLATRQLIAVSALAALRDPEELRVHLWVALKAGVDRATLTEALFQIGTYAGLPATNQALAVLEQVLQVIAQAEVGDP
ncbi:carboxymuconolactone decarboxylase family protein [Thiocystis violacea]|uniref:carboxymuconolactone decarboxylase family protein n=1 Tax=Thiocystis violacea TaxID=13725 RepID=UPI00190582C9|nr:carboxymuconolactone decarboxylase family protein [Thiocystis violacea]MBK1724466.1 hypothetical protein [Thiocystis violacea]